MSEQLGRAKVPCAECPFRRDTPPGQFPAERYELLRESCRHPDVVQAPLGAPMFACHKSREGEEFACAGWLAVEGYNHIGVRVALAFGQVPAAALRPGEGWPELFDSYEEMADAQGRET